MPALCVVDPVARSVGQPKFHDALAHSLDVPRIAMSQPVDPGQDPQPALAVLQPQPPVEVVRGEDLDHMSILVDRWASFKDHPNRPTLGDTAMRRTRALRERHGR